MTTANFVGIADDELYDEYVMGPRRKRNPMGTYRGQMRIKSVNEPAKRTRENEGNEIRVLLLTSLLNIFSCDFLYWNVRYILNHTHLVCLTSCVVFRTMFSHFLLRCM